jgi:hypothetical protein
MVCQTPNAQNFSGCLRIIEGSLKIWVLHFAFQAA